MGVESKRDELVFENFEIGVGPCVDGLVGEGCFDVDVVVEGLQGKVKAEARESASRRWRKGFRELIEKFEVDSSTSSKILAQAQTTSDFERSR